MITINRESKWKRLPYKVVAVSIAFMLVFTQMTFDQFVHAESDMTIVEIKEQDNYTKVLNANVVQTTIKKLDLLKDGKVLASKEVSNTLSFEVYTNGDYQLVGYDEKGTKVDTQDVSVDSFENSQVEMDAKTHQVTLLSRYEKTAQVKIEGSDTKTVDTVETKTGVYEAVYDVLKNGTYTFSILDSDKNVLGKESLDVKDVPNVNKAGEILLSSEDDLKQMITNPSGTFVIDQDIEMTSDMLKDVNFTGKLKGNGYTISGIQERLFQSVTNAEISNIVIKGRLAETSTNTTIQDTGFYVEASDTEKDNAVILKSTNTTINHSFAFMNVEGKHVAGFILEGTASIENSYVSGYLSGKEVYGFAKDADITNSYIMASLVGDTRVLFSKGELKDCFYDAQINDLEETKATPYYTNDLTSKKFSNQEFMITGNQYPQIKGIESMQEQAQQVSTLSVLAVTTKSNLSALESAVQVEEKDNLEWTSEDASVFAGNAAPSRNNGTISAIQDNTTNRFALRKARAVSSIKASDSTTSKTTQITIPTTMGTYYKVVATSETAPVLPTSHKAAIENGWKLMYWRGDYKWTGLDWNTNYTVYSSNLTANTTEGTIQTNYGKLGGKITLSGTYDFGEVMTATLSDTNNTTKGTLEFQTADTLNENAVWTRVGSPITMDGSVKKATFTVTDAQAAKYLRVRFVADTTTGYEGTLYATTDSVIKENIASVTIVNRTSSSNFTLNDQLIANIDPSGKENDVDFTWYQKDVSEAIGTGRNYKLKSSDVGKQIYVKATAKTNGDVKGEVDSTTTSVVTPIQCTKPDATKLKEVAKEDITATIEMDVADNLYRFGIATSAGGTIKPYAILSRGKTHSIITNLTANTMYYIYVQQVGENGYTDSEWSDGYLTITTDKDHVRGDVVITGNAVYKETLTATIKNGLAGQTGAYAWYRLDANGNRGTKNTGSTYTLAADDIGFKIEAVYEGTGGYAGEVSTISNTIAKEEKTAPDNNLTIGAIADRTIGVTLPSNSDGEKYIIGISNTSTGVPIEQLNNDGTVKEFPSGDNYTFQDLERDTEYYVFIRYAGNDTHQKSDWIDSNKAIQVKTNKKDFVGRITFTYPTADLMKGQTLTANLIPVDSGFNYKGEWTWKKVASDGSTTVINNFALTDNKQGTTYVVPNNEDTGVKYKVTFTANVGYTGNTESTSLEVKPTVKGKYSDPDVNDIVLEAIDDESIKLMMAEGEGQYKFYYKEDTTNFLDSMGGFFTNMFTGDDGYTEAGSPVGSNVDLVVKGLKRNTKYIVKVQRITDDNGEASDFVFSSDATTVYTSARTKKTEITGKVEIVGKTRFGETLTASYTAGTYANTPAGSDNGGSWQWYRGTEKITSATATTYTLQTADIGQTIKAEYTMPEDSDFKGSASVTTKTIDKALCVLPEISGIVTKDITGVLTMVITGNMTSGDQIYYRVQKEGSTAPEYPTTADLNSWNLVGASETEVTKDVDNANLVANTRYIVYFVKLASETNEGSSVMSKDYTMGTHSQKGTVALTGNMVVGKTLIATLTNLDNTKGTWKWYKSTQVYPTITSVPNAATESLWTEITSGYSPATNSATSQLNVSEDLFGHYIRAEFVANAEQGYSGTVRNTGTNNDFIKKIYEETLTLTSSTKDGNGNPKAYENSVITGTINNHTDKDANIDRATVQFKIGGNTISSATITKNTFKYTMPSNASYDGQEITAEVSKPRTIALYVDKDLNALTAGTLNSKVSTSTSFTYTQGIPISSPTDLANFLTASGSFSNRSAKYILTSNINMKDTNVAPSTVGNGAIFYGTLDGDFHTVTKMKTMFVGEAGNGAVFKNLIINESSASADGPGERRCSSALASITKGTVTIEKVFLSQSVLHGSYDGGGLVGKSYDNLIVRESIGAGNKVYNDDAGFHLVGGLVGFAVDTNSMENSYTINSEIISSLGTADYSGSAIGGTYARRSHVTLKNVYGVGKVPNTVKSGGVIGASHLDGASSQDIRSLTNVFYDKDILPGLTYATDAYNGKGLNTSAMVGNNLTAFGSDKWTYATGYYPRLKWVENHPIAKLYAATRGAFISLDSNTTAADMFNGNISSAIQIPTELQTKDYTVTSSNPNILKVGDNGTIIPVGTSGQKATITITYTEPDATIGGSASNTYEFTVATQVTEIAAVTIKDNAGNALTSSNSTTAQGLPNPQMNETLKADPAQGIVYRWYRRPSGTTQSELIEGNSNRSTYTLTSADIGCEIAVLVIPLSGAPTYSPYTKATVAIKPTAPAVSNVTDSSVVLKPVNGAPDLKYEFGYMRADQNASPTLIEGTCDKDGSITVGNLLRNKQYNFYVRVGAKSGAYEASDWSATTTRLLEKTVVSGNVSFGANINNGSNLSISIEKTNGQTGTWKLERVNTDGTITLINNSYNSTTSFNYPLVDADVGTKIKATFTGSGDFKDTVVGTSDIVKKKVTNAPVSPVKVSDTYNSLTVKMANAGDYEIAYADSTTSTKTTAKEHASNENVTITGLKRNKTYYVFARVNGTDASETSGWSNEIQMTTGKEAMNVAGTITMDGATKTDDTMCIELTNGSNYTGTWTLYTVADSSTKFTISPSLYSVNPTTNEVTYKIRAKDAGKKLGAEFSGNGDFSGSIDLTSPVLANAKLDGTTDMPTDIIVSNTKDTSMEVNANSGNQNYQYGYVTKGGVVANVRAVDATGYKATKITISGLKRNTEYDIYVRKAAETGYDASDWVKMLTSATTAKSTLTGTVNYQKWDTTSSSWKDAKVGVAEMGAKYKATYTAGTYDDSADDSASGHWQWYANDAAITDATTDTYTIAPMVGDVEITVKYVANDDAAFKDARSASIGTLTKPTYDVPSTLPTVTALSEDGNVGSQLKITSSDVADVYYYVQQVKVGTVPEVVLSSVAETNRPAENKWFKAESDMTLVLDPNTEYVVYVSRLEDGGHKNSGVVSQRSVKTKKENLDAIDSVVISEADDTTEWKVQQQKELRFHIADKPVDGVWQYYVSKTPAVESSWQNITSEIKDTLSEGKSATYSYTKITMPIKYSNGYNVRVIFTGRGNAEGTKTYTSTDPLIGTQIQGHVEINSGAANEVFVPIEVNYVYAKNSSNADIKDEDNGIWTWYRETAENSGTYEEISRTTPTVGLTDTYTPTVADVNKKIYAVYTCPSTGIYSGSVESAKLSNTERATQNTPDPITSKQVNGTTIQINLPSNFKTEGKTVAQPVLEYRKAGDTDWIVNKTGDAWIGKGDKKLKANTVYEVQACFNGTSEYKPSVYTAEITVTTGNQSFDEDKLVVTQPSVLETGSEVTAKFTGSGYDDGYFKVSRSDGTILSDNITGTINGITIATTYDVTSADIGSNIIVQYHAKTGANTYGGYVEKNTDEVLKPANPNKPGSPTLTTIRLHEDQLEVDVDDTCEYVLNTSATAVAADSGDWKKLTKDSSNKHLFENLTKGTEYYLHVRFAETENYRVSEENMSAKTSPWERGEYAITYHGTEGATNTNPTKYTELDSEITLVDAEKAGYTFKGWTTTPDGTPAKGLKIPSGSDGAKEFTAHWDIVTYNIAYTLNDGSLESGKTNPPTYTVESETFTLNNPSKTGYTFDGWTWEDQTVATTTATINKGSTHKDLNFAAHFTINKYIVTFDVNGGDAISPNTLERNYNEALGTLPTPTRAGYTFDGWFKAKTGNDEITAATTMPLNGATYYAHWTIVEYDITYNLDGGTVSTVNKDKYTVESETFTLNNPSKTGYTFTGWTWEDQSAATTTATINKGSTHKDLNFVAHFTINKYTATFDVNGGDAISPNTLERNYNEALGTLPTPTRAGYTFDGWFKAKTGNDEITAATTMPLNGATYYAHWAIVEYDITYNLDGGTVSTVNKDKYTVESETFTLNNPSKTGYTFTGWTWEDQSEATTTATINKGSTHKNLNFVAHFTINKYTATFNSNGGTETEQTIKRNYDVVLGALPTATRTGYTLDGWYTAPTGGTPITATTTMPANDITYYAHWNPVEYTITYHLDSGVNDAANPDKYTIETAEITLNEPTRVDYVFKGWTWDTQTTPQKVVKIEKGTTGNKEYTAKWKKADHTVIFDSNGGSHVENGFGTHDEIMEAPENPTKEGYTFKGWFKEAALSNQWNFATDKVIGNMTLYAKWEINHYDVTFDTNGGSVIEKQTIDHGEKANEPTDDPTKDYYNFVGWYSDEELEIEFDFNTLIKGATTIYAKWEAKSYDIAYELDGGKNHKDNPDHYTVEDEITLKSPTKENYTFVGWTWSGQSVPQKEVTIKKGNHGPITYKANWKLNEYQVHFDTNGGNKIDAITMKHGGKVTKPMNPTKDKFIFVGWYSDEKLTKAWDFDNDVVTKETTLYAKYYAILNNVTASSSGAVEKNTKIILSSKEGATIYYTVDGSTPTKDSTKYTEAILIDKTMSIKAMAVKEGYGDSEVTTFEYTVKGNGTVESEKNSPLKPENKKDEIIEAVVTDKEYENYLSGTDVSVRIVCNTTSPQLDDIIKNALDGRTVGAYYDIMVYKTVGDKEETIVTTLRKPIRLVLTVPATLYPEKGVTRVFGVIRIHDDKASLLSDLDKDEPTVTIESDEFSTYVLCYKDIKTSGQDRPVVAPIEKPTVGGNAGSQGTDIPKQGITSNKSEDKKDEPKKEDVTKPTDEKESKKETTNNMLYYVGIPLAFVVLLGIVIVMKLRRKNKE